MKTINGLLTAALSMLLCSTPAPADEKAPAPVPVPATGATKQPGGSERENAGAAEREKAAAATRQKTADPGREVKTPENPDAGDIRDKDGPEAAAVRKIMLEESKFRNHLAKINRLRELAKEQGNEQRLAALDKLEARLAENHHRKIEHAKGKLDTSHARALDDKLKQGRGHAKHDSKDDKSEHDKDADRQKDKGASGEQSKSEKKPDAPPPPKRSEEKPKPPEPQKKPSPDNPSRGEEKPKQPEKDKNSSGGKPNPRLIGGAA